MPYSWFPWPLLASFLTSGASVALTNGAPVLPEASEALPAESAACSPARNLTGQRILFGTHHKTGTVLAKAMSKCLVKHHPELSIDVSGHIMALDRADDAGYTKVIHWVRSPLALVVSSYLYTRTTEEPWASYNGSAHAIINDTYMGINNAEVLPSESYKDYLLRAPVEDGLETELRKFLRPPAYPGQLKTKGHEALQVAIAHDRCAKNKNKCKEVCLERFMADSKSYMAAWRDVLLFLGICLDSPEERDLQKCLQKGDTHSVRFFSHTGHVTFNENSERSNEDMKQMVRTFDEQEHGRALGELEDALGCNVPSYS